MEKTYQYMSGRDTYMLIGASIQLVLLIIGIHYIDVGESTQDDWNETCGENAISPYIDDIDKIGFTISSYFLFYSVSLAL